MNKANLNEKIMQFLRKFDLNFVCRVFEWCAVITFFLGILASIIMSIEQESVGLMFAGLVASFLNAAFWLFLSRVGDAVDDIRNKYVYSAAEEPDGLTSIDE